MNFENLLNYLSDLIIFTILSFFVLRDLRLIKSIVTKVLVKK